MTKNVQYDASSLEALRQTIKYHKRAMSQTKKWDYTIFFLSALVVSGGIYSLFVLKSIAAVAGWIMSIYWMMTCSVYRQQKRNFYNLWIATLEDIILVVEETKRKEEENG